jgi:hypothetical protein
MWASNLNISRPKIRTGFTLKRVIKLFRIPLSADLLFDVLLDVVMSSGCEVHVTFVVVEVARNLHLTFG